MQPVTHHRIAPSHGVAEIKRRGLTALMYKIFSLASKNKPVHQPPVNRPRACFLPTDPFENELLFWKNTGNLEILRSRAQEYIQEREWHRAQRMCTALIDKNSRDGWALLRRAITHFELGQMDKAIGDCQVLMSIRERGEIVPIADYDSSDWDQFIQSCFSIRIKLP